MPRRFVPTSRLTKAVAALTAAGAATAAALMGSAGISAAGAATGWQSGVYVGNANTSGLAAFETWRGAPAPIVTDYFDQSSWSNMLNDANWATWQWHQIGEPVSWSVPMVPSSGGYTLAAGAAGAYDSYFTQLAQILVKNGEGSSILRIGWEFNGNWMPWSAGSQPATYAADFRRIVDTMRAVPGANFKFDWCISNEATNTDVAAAYPGNAYVDYIGDDVYDWDYSTHSVTQRWNDIVNNEYGLAWQASFAASHGKQISFPEWALATLSNGWGGGDDPTFVTNMYDWFANHNTGYESYFDENMGTSELHAMDQGNFPLAEAVYQQLFGAQKVTHGHGSGSGSKLSGPVGKLGSVVQTAANQLHGQALSPVLRTRELHRTRTSPSTRPSAATRRAVFAPTVAASHRQATRAVAAPAQSRERLQLRVLRPAATGTTTLGAARTSGPVLVTAATAPAQAPAGADTELSLLSGAVALGGAAALARRLRRRSAGAVQVRG